MKPDGVTFVDHTADVGIDVAAASLDMLLHRAALGMLALLRGDEEEEEASAGAPARPQPADAAAEPLPIQIAADGPAGLLAGWLRELLFLHEVRHRDYVALAVDRLDPGRLDGRITTAPSAPAVREIKGVTYHGLEVEGGKDGWRARVIFDV